MRKTKKSTVSARAFTEEDLRRIETLLSATTSEVAATNSIIPYRRNVKKHSGKQIDLLAENIGLFGFTNPILVDEKSVILAGHARLEAAKKIGLESVSIIRLSHLTSPQKQALRISDNKLSELSSWECHGR
jgi:ParB-like chromosome segregation protein Spo0J